jgi:Spy/CpxP family protein refolding chaperone
MASKYENLFEMKKSTNLSEIFFVSIALVFTLRLAAQEPDRPPPPPGPRGPMTEEDIERRVDDLSKTLEMTDEQHDRVLKLELEFFTKMQVEREKNMGDREAMRSSMMQMREERDKKFEEILTKEQMEKYRQIQEERRARMQQQREQRDGSGNDDRPSRGRGRN